MDPTWDDNRPIYRQLRDRMVALILEGALRERDPLPSVRALAADYRLNPLTVLKAYQQQGNPQLEEILQLSPEYSFHLLNWLGVHPDRNTANPTEAFKKAMLPDPF